MSGIYIPGMKMPTSCYACPLRKQHGTKIVCPICGESFSNTDENILSFRLKNCSLVPVPPHGRLGDLDALMQKDNDDYDIALLLTTDDEVQSIITRLHIQMQRVLIGTPTIIPADPVKEEQT